ncbi:MAG: ATP-dependent Clp protease ATP-binding subunit [Clostridia bacterium]|nr:ATP-dependent Clp protease ATP-binding subunit [Clostridia bacterium]
MANYTQGYFMVLKTAENLQSKFNISYVGTELVLYAILKTPKCDACAYLNKFGVTHVNYFAPLKKTLKERNVAGYTVKAKGAMKTAIEIADSLKLSYVSTEHMLLAILSIEDCRAMSILRSLGVDIPALYAYIVDRIKVKVKNSVQPEKPVSKTGNPDNAVNEAVETAIYQPKVEERVEKRAEQPKTSPLDDFGYYLTERALSGDIDPVIGREEEISRVIQTLSRKTKNSPLLLGEAGVGKTSVVEGLALKIASGEAPEFLRNKKIFSLDLGGLLSGTKFRGEFEERLKTAVDYAISDGNIIFFIDEIHNIVGAGSTSDGKFDTAEFLKPMLARGELSVIGATTNEEYTKYIEKDSALERRFQPINIKEPSVDVAIEILRGIKPVYEAHHKIIIKDEAIVAAVRLSDRYVTSRFLPDKAIDLIDEAASKKHVEITSTPRAIITLEKEINKCVAERDYAISRDDLDKAKEYEAKISELVSKIRIEKEKDYAYRSELDPCVTEEDIKKLISVWTKIPVADLSGEDTTKLMSLEDSLMKKVVGQTKAIECVSRAVRRSRANVNDPDKPIGTFLFVGPTGVGKTELAKALSESVFGDKNSLIRFDMSEYQDKTAINKLIGSAPGYVGYEQEGLLSEKVRKNPYSVVLFDEIEKASPEIYDVLLQIMGEGRLSDNKGRLINFKNTIIILTSNVGYSKKAVSSIGFGIDSDNLTANEELKRHFKAEFLNRLDEIVVFNHLSKSDCYDVADILINELIRRVNSQGYKLFVDNSAMDVIVNDSYSAEYGARNIKRAISRYVEDLLSDAIIMGEIVRGDVVRVVGKDGTVTYEKY